MDGRKPLLEYDALERTVEKTDPIGGCGMKEGLKSLTLLGHPKTGPRRTLPTAKESQDLGRQRRYPVLGWPSSCIWKNFTPLTTMINLLNLTDTTPFSGEAEEWIALRIVFDAEQTSTSSTPARHTDPKGG